MGYWKKEEDLTEPKAARIVRRIVDYTLGLVTLYVSVVLISIS